MWNDYYSPETFELSENSDNIILNKKSVSFNAEKWAQKLIKDMEDRKKAYLHDEMFI